MEEKYIEAGKIAAQALSLGCSLIKVGASLLEVSDKVEEKIVEMRGDDKQKEPKVESLNVVEEKAVIDKPVIVKAPPPKKISPKSNAANKTLSKQAKVATVKPKVIASVSKKPATKVVKVTAKKPVVKKTKKIPAKVASSGTNKSIPTKIIQNQAKLVTNNDAFKKTFVPLSKAELSETMYQHGTQLLNKGENDRAKSMLLKALKENGRSAPTKRIPIGMKNIPRI